MDPDLRTTHRDTDLHVRRGQSREILSISGSYFKICKLTSPIAGAIVKLFWANKVGRESGHVEGLSRPSDQPNQRSRSGRYRSFCKKALELTENSARTPGFFHMNL
jgi:hypothetical protein